MFIRKKGERAGVESTVHHEDRIKPVTILVNGIIVGAGAAVLISALIGVAVLSSSYASISSSLVNYGMPVVSIPVKLAGIINLLSICPGGIILGSSMIILGLLNQFSRRMKFAYERKDGLTRMADGLICGGVIMAGLSGGSIVRQFYDPIFGIDEISVLVILVGIALLALGVFLLVLRNPNENI